MVDQSGFRGVIEFLGKVGVYDVILPFLLVFTIIFAILEKTKIFGYDKIGDKQISKKNLNSMVSFVTAFLVIASTQLVSIINEVMANVVLLLILGICFMLLIGVFFKEGELTLDKFPKWLQFFMVLMFIGIVLIFLNALGWLQNIINLFQYWDDQWATTIIFMIIVVGFIIYITMDTKGKKEEKNE